MAERGGRGSGGHGSLDKSITLPPDEIFRNLENAKRFAIDIGNRAGAAGGRGGRGKEGAAAEERAAALAPLRGLAGARRPTAARGSPGNAVP